jgi:hypothetical protein
MKVTFRYPQLKFRRGYLKVSVYIIIGIIDSNAVVDNCISQKKETDLYRFLY